MCARALRRLLIKARVAIEKFCENFEKEMLGDFDRAYKEGDPHVMAASITQTPHVS